MRSSILLWTLLASSSAPPDQGAESRALVQRLVLDRAAAVASVQRIADEREEQLFAELGAKDRRLRAERSTRKEAEAELAKVTAERQRLVDEIAERDRQFAAEITEYRRQVTSIADSADPRKREALKRYAEGDRAGGFDALVAIQEAETKAVAAGWREIAELAQDRKDRGEMGTAEVIQLFERALAMDSDDAWAWFELKYLYADAGRLPDARRAVEQALAHAKNDWQRAHAVAELGDMLAASGDLAGARAQYESSLKLHEHLAELSSGDIEARHDVGVDLIKLGDVLVAAGDLSGARARYEESLKIAERILEASPGSVEAQRDVSRCLDALGNVLGLAGDLSGAVARLEPSLKMRERILESNPSSTEAQRDVSVSLSRLGDVLGAVGDLSSARALYEASLKIQERLAEHNPSSVAAQSDISVHLERLGDALMALGDLPGARARYESSLKIREHLVELSPGDAEAQANLNVILRRLGDVLLAAGDLSGARARYEMSLEIAERLVQANPSNTEAQRDLIASHDELGRLPEGKEHLSEALRIALDLQKTGRLPPSDSWMIDDLRKRIAAAEEAEP